MNLLTLHGNNQARYKLTRNKLLIQGTLYKCMEHQMAALATKFRQSSEIFYINDEQSARIVT